MPELESEWRKIADEIRADILEHGVRDNLRQHYDTNALDASTLLAAVFGFLPADDARLRSSVLAIAEDTEHGFVLRYRNRRDRRWPERQGDFALIRSSGWCRPWRWSGDGTGA